MKSSTAMLLLTGVLVCGCESQSGGPSGGAAGPAAVSPGQLPGMLPPGPETGGIPEALPETSTAAAESKATPVPIDAGVSALSPENTKIVFVGTHIGARPDPRTGGFEKFSGKVEVDPSTKLITSITVDIEAASLWTQIPNLTNHLKSPDFFDVREHPQAAFQSTIIKADGAAAGTVTITGNLTLHGAMKEISFPAKVNITDDGLTLTSNFTIDRTEFGMTFGADRVETKVSLTVVIGEKTEVTQASGFGAGGGPGRGPGRRPSGQGSSPGQAPAAPPTDGQDK